MERCSALSVVANEKGAFGLPSTRIANFTFLNILIKNLLLNESWLNIYSYIYLNWTFIIEYILIRYLIHFY